MKKGKIKLITSIIPPMPPRVEHEADLDLQGVMEEIERRLPFAPALSQFDLKAGGSTNFKRVVLKQKQS